MFFKAANPAPLFVVAGCLPLFFLIPNTGGAGLELPINSLSWLLTILSLVFCLPKLTLPTSPTSATSILCIALILLILASYLHPDSHVPHTLLIGTGFTCLIFLLVGSTSTHGDLIALCSVLVAFGVVVSGHSLLEMYNYRISLFEGKISSAWIVGPFQQKNVNGSFIATALVGAFVIFEDKPSRSQNKLVCFAVCATIILLTVAVTISGSRTAWFSTLLALTFVSIASPRYKSVGVLCVLVGVGVVAGSILLYTSELGEVVRTKLHAESSRWDVLYPRTWQLIMERPLTGYGYGTFATYYAELQAAAYQNDPQSPIWSTLPKHPHNFLLFWWYNSGLIAPLLIIGASVNVLAAIFRLRSTSQALKFLALLIPIGAHMMLEFPLRASAIHWIVVSCLIALAISPPEFQQSHGRSISEFVGRKALYTLQGIIILSSTVFLANNAYVGYRLWQYQASSMNTRYLDNIFTAGSLDQRYQRAWYEAHLLAGVSQRSNALLEAYVVWAQNEIQHSRNLSVYQGLGIAYDVLGHADASAQIKSEMAYYYPKVMSGEANRE